jgi:hypothetical protein
MMVVIRNLPKPLAELASHLESSNFVVSASEDRQGFGDRLETLARGDLMVRFVRDRGEWRIEVKSETWDDWFDPDVWRSCLTGTDIPVEPGSLAEQATFVNEKVNVLVEALAKDSDRALYGCLLRNRTERARRRLGIE